MQEQKRKIKNKFAREAAANCSVATAFAPSTTPTPAPKRALQFFFSVSKRPYFLPSHVRQFLHQQGFQTFTIAKNDLPQLFCFVVHNARNCEFAKKWVMETARMFRRNFLTTMLFFDPQIGELRLQNAGDCILIAYRTPEARSRALLQELRSRKIAIRQHTFRQLEHGYLIQVDLLEFSRQGISKIAHDIELDDYALMQSVGERSPPSQKSILSEIPLLVISQRWLAPAVPRAQRAPNPPAAGVSG